MTNRISSLTNPPRKPQNEKRTRFPSTLFLRYFLCLLRQSLSFLTVWLTLSFPFFLFFVFTDILPDSFFSERKVDVCQERIEGCSLFQKGSGSQERRAQLESSQTRCKRKWNLQTGRPQKNTFLEKAGSENERIQKCLKV